MEIKNCFKCRLFTEDKFVSFEVQDFVFYLEILSSTITRCDSFVIR